MDRQIFMKGFEDVVRVCRTNDVTTEAEDGVLEAAAELLRTLPDKTFEERAETQPEPKCYEPDEDPEGGLELYAVEVEWDYLKTIGVRARSEEEALGIAEDLDRLGIIGPDPNCRIEGEEAKIVDAAGICGGCPAYSAEDCREPGPKPQTEADTFSDRLLGHDPLAVFRRIVGRPLSWQNVYDIWFEYEKVRFACELSYRLVNCCEDYHNDYAMVARDICIGRVSPTAWFENAFGAYWDRPQFCEGFDDDALQAWKDSLPAEPLKDASEGRKPEA